MLGTSNTAIYQFLVEFNHTVGSKTSVFNSIAMTGIYNNLGDSALYPKMETIKDYLAVYYYQRENVIGYMVVYKMMDPFANQPKTGQN